MTQSHLRSPATGWSLLFGTVLLAGAVFASSGGSAEVDASDVREAVQTQMQALAADDAAKAFALADPALRTRFGTAEEFLDTVRKQYPMVLRPVGLLFMKPESDGTIALQKVRVTDDQGIDWRVTYVLNRQRGDPQWRISACVVEAAGPHVVT